MTGLMKKKRFAVILTGGQSKRFGQDKQFAQIDGQSFLPLLLGDDSKLYSPTLYSELDLDGRVIRSLTRGNFKLIDQRLPLSEAGWKLYDLSKDRTETLDVASSHREIVEALVKTWDTWHRDIGDLHKTDRDNPKKEKRRKKS